MFLSVRGFEYYYAKGKKSTFQIFYDTNSIAERCMKGCTKAGVDFLLPYTNLYAGFG